MPEVCGNVPSGWKMCSIKSLATCGGLYGSGAPALPYDADLPRYVRITDITSDGRLDAETRASITYRNAEGNLLSRGDLLFARSGATVGKTYLYREDDGICAHAGYVIRFPIEPTQADAAYVFHWTQSPSFSRWVARTLRQGAQPNINAREYAGHQLPVPPLPEQRQIAAILDTIDDAILTTEQIIAKLKQVKQGLLHDLLTRGIDDNGELRDPERHPEQFKDSPLGRIPREWEVVHLERSLAGPPKNGHSPTAVDEWTGRLMLGLGCLSDEGFVPTQLKNAPRQDSRLDAASLRHGDLLVSRANTRELVGLAGIYRDIGVPCTYPDLMMRLTPVVRSASAEFLELVLRSQPLRRQIEAAAVGTSASMVKISGAIVRKLVVPLPPLVEQSRILASATAEKEGSDAEMVQHGKLGLLKAGLMEDLLTGRVRVTSLLESA